MIEIKMPAGAEKIISQLVDAGYEAYIVGGCVRDSLLGKEPKDWDICTSANTDEIKECFSGCYVINTGIKHGTLTILKDGEQYEVTTFRIDGQYSDNRRPDSITFTNNLEEDLARRDFTINSMAYNYESGLIDIYGGYNDLQNKTIRCVGNANERFNEDALRILRALRFASQLNFKIEELTRKSILDNYNKLANISAERINAELCKIVRGSNILYILQNYNDVFAFIIPPFKQCIGFNQNNKFHQHDVYNHIAHAVNNYSGNDLVVKITLLLHDIGKPMCYSEDENGGHFYKHNIFSHYLATKVLNDLKFNNYLKANILELIDYHDANISPTPRSIKKWLNKIGVEQFRRLLDVKLSDIMSHNLETQSDRIDVNYQIRELLENIIEEEQCFTLKDLNINGRDIISLGVCEGKLVGEVLNYLLNSVIDELIQNDKDKLIEAAKKYIEERCAE